MPIQRPKDRSGTAFSCVSCMLGIATQIPDYPFSDSFMTEFSEVASQRGGFAKRCLRADLGEKERHSSRGEVLKIRSYRLAFVRGEAALQLLQILEVQLCDQVIGQLAAIGSGDDLGRLEPL